MSIFLCICFLFLGLGNVYAQIPDIEKEMHPPLKIPLVLSGSFGELRSTHFHAGVDFKTNGRCGYRIYSSEEGYVVRIVVSPVGYGKAVYVVHPNGLMTVYAHLRNFSPKIERFIRNKQYEKESWAIDIGLGKEELVVERGEILGLSGNTGSSGGPHLHYEIRCVDSQEPINPLFFFKTKDDISPKIRSLYVYNINNKENIFSTSAISKNVGVKGGKYYLKDVKQLALSGRVGFGLEVEDFFTGSWNSCGVYSLSMFVDGIEKYRYVADRFSFAKTSYINVVKDYRLHTENTVKVYKSWFPEGCSFCSVKLVEDGGFLDVLEDSVYNVKFEVCDMAGNKSEFEFDVVGKDVLSGYTERGRYKYKSKDYNKIEQAVFCLEMQPNTLFGDVSFLSSVDTVVGEGFVGDLVFNVGGDYVPLRRRAKLSVGVDTNIVDKSYIVNAIGEGDFSAVSTIKEGDSLYCNARNLGRYAVCIDTIAPKVAPLGDYQLKYFANNSKMRFKIEDKESGIGHYEAMLNGQWVMASYDAKQNLLEVILDKKRLKTDNKYKFVLSVYDNCGNNSCYEVFICL